MAKPCHVLYFCLLLIWLKLILYSLTRLDSVVLCYCCVDTRRSAYPLLPLVCSIMELVTWSSTSSASATHSWQRSWLNNTSRSSWATLSVYITHTHTYAHTCCLILLLKCKFTSLFSWNVLLYSFLIWQLCCRKKKTADFLRDAVETRLRMYIPYIETWPQV